MLLDTVAASLRNSNIDAFSSAARAPKSLAIILLTFGRAAILDLFVKYDFDISTEQSKDIYTKMGYNVLRDNSLEVGLANANLNLSKEDAVMQIISESSGKLTNEAEVRCALCLKAIYQ